MHQSLGDHIPGQAAIHELLSQRQRDAPVSLLGRIFGADPLSAETRPWFQGVLGEIAVGKILSSLGPEWTVLHAVPVGVGSSDIDHVVIGPGGVFTLNTKNHTGQPVWVAGRTLMVAGKRKNHIPQRGVRSSTGCEVALCRDGQAGWRDGSRGGCFTENLGYPGTAG